MIMVLRADSGVSGRLTGRDTPDSFVTDTLGTLNMLRKTLSTVLPNLLAKVLMEVLP